MKRVLKVVGAIAIVGGAAYAVSKLLALAGLDDVIKCHYCGEDEYDEDFDNWHDDELEEDDFEDE